MPQQVKTEFLPLGEIDHKFLQEATELWRTLMLQVHGEIDQKDIDHPWGLAKEIHDLLERVNNSGMDRMFYHAAASVAKNGAGEGQIRAAIFMAWVAGWLTADLKLQGDTKGSVQ